MDSALRQVVQQLLRPTDTCVHAVQGKLLGLSDLAERLLAVVKHEAREEYVLFIFSVDRTEQPPYCTLDGIYPIRAHFSARTQEIKGGRSQVLVETADGSTLLLNLPSNQYPQVFIAQLNKAIQQFNQSASRDSVNAFDWLLGYEECHTGWDRFCKPGQHHLTSTTSSDNDPFLATHNSEMTSDPLLNAFPERWPWSHIITPNCDGSTDIATCEQQDISEFDPLANKTLIIDEPNDRVSSSSSPTPVSQPPPPDTTIYNPFDTSSTNPFSSSPVATPPIRYLVPTSGGGSGTGMRPCTSESNLPHLQTEIFNHRSNPFITRSTENLVSIEEDDRHCVAMAMKQQNGGTGRLGVINDSGSTSSLSDGSSGWEIGDNGDNNDKRDFNSSVQLKVQSKRKGRRRRDKNVQQTVAADQRYSHFEVITDNEVVGITGRKRLNCSPDLRDLHKPREAVRMKFKNPTGSQTGVSKANMEQPELTTKLLSSLSSLKPRMRAETRAQSGSSSRWITRYRPGMAVPLTNIRESFIQAELRQKEKEFCTKQTYRVFCGSWNVNGKPPSTSLDQFLLEFEGQGENGKSIPPDIYAVGFQELDLSAQALVGAESGREELWTLAVEQTLEKIGLYHKLLHIRLVGILLLIYIKPHLLTSVTDQDTDCVTTGIGGVLGNKGGVGARFNLFHTSLCFVNCHFAASMEEVDKRNHDYHTIRNKMLFSRVQDYKYTIMEHDMVFWIGDMNYRIQTSPEMTVEVIKAHADNFQISSLLREDQLVQEMTKGNVFNEFAEGAIDFKPTYKYDPNTDNWDSSEKHRPPAWCDRILYHGMGNELRGYRSHPKMKISDHKPVSASFNCDVCVVDPGKEKDTLEEITRKLDKLENDTLPQVDLSQTEFIFKDVKFQEPQFNRLTVTNTGSRPVLVSFIPKLDEETYCKPWIDARPSSAIVQPLQDVAIVLTVSVDCDTAPSLNHSDKIEDILVLHLEGGKDFFLSVTGNYLPSCFGSSLETLVHLHTYIREVPTAELLDLSWTSSWDHCSTTPQPSSSSSSSSSPSPPTDRRAPSPHTTPPHDIPKEIFQIVSFLNTHALKKENLFQEGGRQGEIQQIINALDVGGARGLPGSAHSVASCLLLFLSALSEPVMPIPLHQRAMDCCNQPMLCKQLLLNLPRVNQRTFTYLIAFMKRLLSNSEENGLDPKLLATIFGDILLRSPTNERRVMSKKQLGPISRKKATFIYQFLIADLTADYR